MREVRGASGARHYVRLLGFIPGTPAGDVRRHSAEYRRDLGRCVGAIDRALEEFDHPAAHREFHWDLARGVETCRAASRAGGGRGSTRADSRHSSTRSTANVTPLLPQLPRSVIHNDANDFNVIVRDDGDAVRAPPARGGHHRLRRHGAQRDRRRPRRRRGVRVARRRAIRSPPPRRSSADTTCERPLSGRGADGALRPHQAAALHERVHGRAPDAASGRATSTSPISQRAITRTLPVLARVHPRFAEAAFRHACGLPPSPASRVACGRSSRRTPGHSLRCWARPGADTLTHIALDVASPLVSGDPAQNAEPLLTRADLRRDAGARRDRGLRPLRRGADGLRRRRVRGSRGRAGRAPHGAPRDRPLRSRRERRSTRRSTASCVAAQNNAARLDYGPVIILEHATGDGAPFFTLYGHLSEDSLDGLAPGRTDREGRADRAPRHAGRQRRMAAAPPLPGDHGPARPRHGLSRASRVRRSARSGSRSVPIPHALLGIPPDAEPAARADEGRNARGAPASGSARNLQRRVPRPGQDRARRRAVPLRRRRPAHTSTRTTTCRTSGTAIRAWCARRRSSSPCSTPTRATCTTP